MALTDEAIAKIKGMILGGELKPGDRLPREADLAARLNLSRNSLREAVRALSVANILDVRQGDGTYVTSLDVALLLEALNFVVDFHQDNSVLYLFEVRRILEPAATAMATQRITDVELKELGVLLDSTGGDDEIEHLVAVDLEFHKRITAAAGNPALSSLIEGLTGGTMRARIWRGLTELGAKERTVAEHHAIYTALCRREADVARSWATVHVAGVEQWLRSAL